MRIKICGITRLEDALLAAEAGADFIGLVQAESPRRVKLGAARDIVAALPSSTAAVVVFRDAALEEVIAAVEATRATWVQLHGNEPIAYAAALRNRMPQLHLIRAFEIGGPADADRAALYLSEAERAGGLFDASILDAPKGTPHPGLEVLAAASRACRPHGECWLAGALTPENVAEWLRAGTFTGVDAARGVESAPGVKDGAAVRRFMQAVRAAAM